MGWVYDIEHTKDGKQITVKVGIKNPKEVPGALVHWIDTKGDIHHEYVPIYTKGKLKDKPKSTVHGCLDKDRYPILFVNKEIASQLVTKYNSLVRKYKKNPEEYDDLRDKTGKDLSTAIREKANNIAIIYAQDMKKSRKNALENWKTLNLEGFANKKHKIDQKLDKLEANPNILAKKKLTIDDAEKLAKREKRRLVNKTMKAINDDINKKAKELINTPNSGIYIDKDGHMRMGILDVKMSDSMKNKIRRHRNKAGDKLRASNFQKLNDYNRKPRAKPSVRKLGKKEDARHKAQVKAEKQLAKKQQKFIKSMDSEVRRRRVEADEEYARDMDAYNEEMKANIMDY